MGNYSSKKSAVETDTTAETAENKFSITRQTTAAPITTKSTTIASTTAQPFSNVPRTTQSTSTVSITAQPIPTVPITTQSSTTVSNTNVIITAQASGSGTSSSHVTPEGKKNVQRLRELVDISHPHVYKYFHQLKDQTGAIEFPQDPKQLNLRLKRQEKQIRKIANKDQEKVLFPDGSNETDSKKFDLSLFKMLIKNFAHTNKSRRFWLDEPQQNDTSDEANISRLMFGRNSTQHCTPDVSDNDFRIIATNIINALVALGEDKNKLQNLLPPVQYGLSKPVNNFFGRANDLDEIHTMVLNGRNGILRVVVYAMSGFGKSETVRKYCDEFTDIFDNNILWINAGNQTSLESSFTQIADMVGLTIRDGNGNLKEITTIINSVHKHFQYDPILYVFDDVLNIQSLTPFLPKHKPSASIITTQLKHWPKNNFQTYQLQQFEESEGRRFLEDNLKDKKMNQTQVSRVLKLICGHPLALQQFVVAIKNTMLSVEEYLNLLEKETAKILEQGLVTMQGEKSAIGAIRITIEKLAETKGSKLALDILNTICYFYGDNISFEVLKLTFPIDVIDIENAVQKLESYSLIKKYDDVISIHSLIQKTVISQHENLESYSLPKRFFYRLLGDDKYFQNCFKMFQNQLDVKEEKSNHESFGKEWYEHLIYFISTNINNTKIHDLLHGKFYQILDTLKTKGRINDLINFMESLLKTFTKKNGPSHIKTVYTMDNLANCYYAICQYDKAIELNQKVIDGKTKRFGKSHERTLISMNNLASCYQDNGRLDDAIKIHEEVLDERKKLFGKSHASTLTSMNNLASCYKANGRINDAIKIHEEVLDERIKLFGKSHERTLTSMINLASCYKDIGRINDALKMNEEVLDESKKMFGKSHESTLTSMNNLALCYKDIGRINDAIKIHEEVLDEYTKMFGKSHESTLTSMNNLASCYKGIGRMNDAIKIHEEVLDETTKMFGKSHERTLKSMNNLALCYKANGRLNDAIKINEEVLDESTKLFGKSHESTLRSMNNLASCYKDNGRLDDAVKMHEEVLDKRTNLLGKSHERTLTSMKHLASCYHDKGRLDDAIKIHEEVLDKRTNLLGKSHPATLRSMNHLGSCYKDKGRLKEGNELLKEAFEISKSSLGENHTLTNKIEKKLLS